MDLDVIEEDGFMKTLLMIALILDAISDPEFEDWLRDTRAQLEKRLARRQAPICWWELDEGHRPGPFRRPRGHSIYHS